MKFCKKGISSLLTLVLVFGLSACSAGDSNQPVESTDSSLSVSSAEQSAPVSKENDFPFTLVTKDDQEVTFTKVPETILCTNVNTGDQLMAMGLGDKIIATANNNTRVSEKFREAYEAIPQMEGKPTLETILDMEPDFIYGRSSAFSDTNNTTHDTLSSYNIMSLSSIEGYKLGADLEDVYQDFYNLGRIFQLEDKAEEIVSGMKEKIATLKDAVKDTETVKVFVYDKAKEEGAYTCGNNFTATLIGHAGGENIFADLEKTWQVVSWEEIVERNPDVIVIDDYGDIPLETKIAELKENPALATVTAIQNDNIISVTLCEVFASSQIADTLEKFAHAFHPECFQ